jgi:DNA-binding SARP family transcriptional activator
VINFEILGRVTAQQDDWTADLSPQQQLLLAILVMARGTPVPRTQLERALWDEEDRSPNGALKRVASELRVKLRPAVSAADPLPGGSETYCLTLHEQQADVLRFRAKIAEARRSTDRESSRLMREGLREWGPDADGLYGGNPLSGLEGHWASSKRAMLRTEYRDARFQCLRQDMLDGLYDRVSWECAQLGTGDEALSDEPFIEIWMLAAFRAGQRIRAEQVFRLAADAAVRHLGVPLSGRLGRLAELIRDEDPRLRGPGDLSVLTSAGSVPAINDRRPMSEPIVTFHNSGNVKVGVQTPRVDAPITINMEPTPVPDNDPAGEPDDQDPEPRPYA